jgi:hypothetical protein
MRGPCERVQQLPGIAAVSAGQAQFRSTPGEIQHSSGLAGDEVFTFALLQALWALFDRSFTG